MDWIIQKTARLVQAGQKAYERKWSFLGLFLFAFFASVLMLGALGFLPDAASTPVADASTSPLVAAVAASVTPASAELPVKISIPAISLSATIANPATTDISVLDQDLLAGAVRYPTSGELGQENANVVVFGHSSYLPIVKNQAYKTFDGIQKLVPGDTITVYSSDRVYTYAVATVEKESANDAAIPLTVAGQVLTLSTCDSFAAKTDRFVVTANFVESHPIATS